jgi:pyruvate/2-oxoglutarate dehydrogenase complex dihydrolipoamide dehydrogenase (E3) component
MPSKALLRPADALAEARRVPGAAEAVTVRSTSTQCLRAGSGSFTNMDDSGAVPWLEDRSVALIRGYARLEGERRVRVGELLCAAREAVVIAVGSGAAMPAISGLAEARPWTNREVTTARRIPRSLRSPEVALVAVVNT